jgi:hypothetical protein
MLQEERIWFESERESIKQQYEESKPSKTGNSIDMQIDFV